MNKSKSCSNFTRRQLSDSEKILINKYNDIKEGKGNDLIKTMQMKKNDFIINEIEKKLDNNYSDLTYTDKFSKTNYEKISNNLLNVNNINKENNKRNYYNDKYEEQNYELNYVKKNENMKYFKRQSNITSNEIINKYISPPQEQIDNYKEYIDINNNNNKNNLIQNYKTIPFVNFNYINLTESLLYKTQNVIFPSKKKTKTYLKNNLFKNIFISNKIKSKEKNNNIPNLLQKNNEIKYLSNKNQKLIRNLSEINLTNESHKKNDSIINFKFKFNSDLKKSLNTKIIKPYKYVSCQKIKEKTKEKKKKIKNKTFQSNNVNNYSQQNISTNIKINNITKIKNNNNKDIYKVFKPDKKENQKSFLQYSSILSQLIYKNKK